PWLLSGSRVLGANERLRLASCGVNGRGDQLMKSFALLDGVEIAWIVDPDRRLLERRSEEMKERTGKKPLTTTDVRDALADPDVDGIIVAAPNHWHSLMVVWAAQAGKHCYVEKPASHDFHEGRVALEAFKKYGVVVQHGTHNRSNLGWAARVKAVQSGKYGRLAVAHAFACKARQGIGHSDASQAPDWLDWDMWRGPALIDDYNSKYVHYNWHWFWETGNGELNNQGTHQLDLAYWSLDPEMRTEFPTRVTSLGGRFKWDDQGVTPNTQISLAEYPNGQKVLMNVRNVDYDGYQRQVENRFYFEDGGKIIGNRYISPSGESEGLEVDDPDHITLGGPFGAFVKACRENKPELANGSMVEGHYSSGLGHLMNISYRIGEPQPFNEVANRFGDDKIVADQFAELHEIVREGMGVPQDGGRYQVGPWLSFDSTAERFTGEHADRANELLRDQRRDEFELPAPDAV
ncbi:MAG: Gfo/Idh/MocA family oxidoreductase, partial [Phycisphaeraceae bacterium]